MPSVSRPPRWRRIYDATEQRIADQLTSLLRSREFAQLAGLGTRTQTLVNNARNAATEGIWHLVNLPTESDLTQLRSQLGTLDREVRRLTLQLERQLPDPLLKTDGSAVNQDGDQPERSMLRLSNNGNTEYR
ncbi:hypothetical protein [Mycobacteroides chelonae]|uniref:hypothetical protein n=1 Tax=Mycobacteroides chelonae TaxID=1774 RepID=UPI001C2C74CF|nr:hypothetical protein [Mycobacteroides chelonae]MBV0920450.1 hypothetical protein [Mycobacteroides chelonae]